MNNSKLFDFLNIEEYALMIDMAAFNHDSKQLDSIKERFDKIDLKSFYEACKEHELIGVVGNLAISLEKKLPEYWQRDYEKEQERLSFLKDKAREVCKVMNENDIPMVILKNGGIMQEIVSEPVCCPMEDIDSLVKKADFRKAHSLLEKLGFVFKFRSEFEKEEFEKAFRDGSTEYYIEMPDGDKMWFELAWRSVSGRWIRLDLEPDTNRFIDDSIVVDGTFVHVLSPEDNLLQVCIHTAKHSYVRAPGLRLHMDVDRIVSNCEINWEKFLKKVEETHVCTSTYISLYIPGILFDTKIPENVLAQLQSKKTEKLLKQLSRVGLLHPHDRKFSKLQFLKFQIGLYDSFGDMWRTLYPKGKRLQEIYNYKNPLLTPIYVIVRGLDLVGIRKKK